MNCENPEVRFDKSLIAPCGMNCGTCIAFLRKKDHCPGCRIHSEVKHVSVQRCKIALCPDLQKTTSLYCYECGMFPCARIKHIDKRYRTKYRTSFIENLNHIKENGIDSFLKMETGRRTCPNCGALLSVHRTFCLRCRSNQLDTE